MRSVTLVLCGVLVWSLLMIANQAALAASEAVNNRRNK